MTKKKTTGEGLSPAAKKDIAKLADLLKASPPDRGLDKLVAAVKEEERQRKKGGN